MGSIVKMSEATYLGIHALVIIAMNGKRISVKTIAEMTGTSANHLSKVMQLLVKEEYVKSTRGPNGGFSLIKNPAEITLLMVYELFEKRITNESCPFRHGSCPLGKCIFGGIVEKITNEFYNYLKNTTLNDLIDK